MNNKIVAKPVIFTHQPRALKGSEQDLMPGHYSIAIQLFSIAAFTLAFVGWLNETWLFWFENPIWLNRYTEYAIILGFGLWRIFAEKNTYTRKRLIILVFMVTFFWWMIPWLYPVYEPYVGFLWAQPVFPSLHVPGTITFFLILAAVFLFGRRIICGFNCPCVGIRETVGFAFRNKTLRSKWSWRLRHSKWLFFSYYVGIMVVTQFPPNSWTVSFVGGFYLLVALTYFGSFFIAPIVGNRFYCRYLCPYGATFGLLNHAGFYGITMDQEKCNDCQRCEQVCDMGIPVWQQGKKSGRVTALEDCMGCARCVVSCPNDALQIRDVRNLFKKAMLQNASYLLKRQAKNPIQRHTIVNRLPAQRIKDWSEINLPNQWDNIKKQASRCLDCGSPGCINACPLHNQIPQWLEEVAAGNLNKAASIAHKTSNLPEICGTLCPQQRLCEGACTKAKDVDGAVTIGTIERYLVQHATAQSIPPIIKSKPQIIEKRYQIAIIGAGPAGLSCADELNKAGFSVTVFDRNGVIGGLLATGVPSFKLDKQLLVNRHHILQQQGVCFKLNEMINDDNIQLLLSDYDAIFLATGAQQPRQLELAGQQLKGVSHGIDYLAKINNHLEMASNDKNIKDKHIVVLGGGDSAMDCARSAIRQQAAQVTLIYRGKVQQMKASAKEIQAAKEEGVQFLYELSPVEIKGDSDSKIHAVMFKQPSGKRQQIDCNFLILALGQVANMPSWLKFLQLKQHSNGTLVVNQHGKTSHPLIYAGGDNTNGPDLVVTAIAAGRKAAQGIVADFKPLKQLFSSHKKTKQESAVAI